MLIVYSWLGRRKEEEPCTRSPATEYAILDTLLPLPWRAPNPHRKLHK